MPHYMLLIYDDQETWDGIPPEESARIMTAYFDYTDRVVEAGVVRESAALQPVGTATTVRVRGGDRLLTDGPFAETKEQLGGFYLLECDTLDEAIDWAAQIPSATLGSIEVRPVMQIPPREQFEAIAAGVAEGRG